MWPAGHPGLNQKEIVVLISQWRIRGGARGGRLPLFLDQNESQRTEDIFWRPPPTSLPQDLDSALYPTKLFKDPYFLTIIPRARMGSEPIAHDAEGRMGY